MTFPGIIVSIMDVNTVQLVVVKIMVTHAHVRKVTVDPSAKSFQVNVYYIYKTIYHKNRLKSIPNTRNAASISVLDTANRNQ